MNADAIRSPRRGPGAFRLQLPLGTVVGFAAAMLAVVGIAVLSLRSNDVRRAAVERSNHATRVLEQLAALLSTLKDAETSQRGYLLTGNERYLDPYHGAPEQLQGELAQLRALLTNSPTQLARLRQLETSAEEKLRELAETIELKREGNAQAALLVVRTDRGRAAMDRVRWLAGELKAHEQRVAEQLSREWEQAIRHSNFVIWSGSGLLMLLIPMAGYFAARDFRARSVTAWVRAGQATVNTALQGAPPLQPLGEHALHAIADYLQLPLASLYLVDGPLLRRCATYAGPALQLPLPLDTPERIAEGEGLLGLAVKQRTPVHVREVPDGYATVSSSLGRHSARELLIVPALVDDRIYAVLELAFFRPVDDSDRQLLTRVSDTIAIAVRSALERTRVQELLEETQRQAEELQSQQEELRVSNEELEEQSQALRDTQARLESQQIDLEEYNAQLEEQTQVLEQQKAELLHTQAELLDRTSELSRANQYKSEFLANMSHELRTPLNSSLIMAQLLAENREGNLSEEQLRFARTISAAGHDLLALINDILDLAKIEAGKVELAFESVDVRPLFDEVALAFHGAAQQKGVTLEVTLDADAPQSLQTDRQRLLQILRNLLSNAFKFTKEGKVQLRLARAGDQLAFSVSDTGIGIAPEHTELIFEAFRQADGSIHRRFGGTGLGLSISRDLARLLGGGLSVHSTTGHGSTFTLTLPPQPQSVSTPQQPQSAPPSAAAPPARTSARRSSAVAKVALAAQSGDDRQRLAPGERVLLVVDDDPAFARIVSDLAHELHFRCLIAGTADAGFELAQQYVPSAIVLDMVLPDHSGLSVLDRLKRSPRTRHIPVHVISGRDDSEAALAMGAVGYVHKPALREQLLDTFRTLEQKLAQKLRRVLLLEAEPDPRASLRQLLEGDQVEVVAVTAADEALTQLQQSTFDCMVVDLPNAGSLDLLERMGQEQRFSFPPVIIYTANPLTADEEQRLRRHSRSIIVKGAKSKERLLDEVTLFLHQVESTLSPDRQRMLREARDREAIFEGRTILVVEDDVRNIFALTRVFEPRGARVEVARNGREALERLAQLRSARRGPDLVLMDIMMPEMDGLTAMREIRAFGEWKKLPIIALTAKAMPDDQEKCMAAGASDYVAKPLDVDKLLSLVRVWMPK